MRDKVAAYLKAHHTATIATVGAPGGPGAGLPHAATVFYATDDRLRMVFLSKGTSRHGVHIVGGTAGGAPGGIVDAARAGRETTPGTERPGDPPEAGRGAASGAPVAVTVAGVYDDWREIQGLQIWGTAAVLRGVSRASALAVFVRRFPFVAGLLKDPRLARQLTEIEVFRITPARVALTDNSVGFFGREVLDLGGDAAYGGAGLGDPTACGEGGCRLRGTVVAGRQEAAGFIDIPWVRERIAEILGAEPYPGTLNLRLRDPAALSSWRLLAERGACLEMTPAEEGFCAARFYPVLVGGAVPAGIVRPLVQGYPDDVVELVAGERLRDTLGLSDGDEVVVQWE